MNQEQAKAWLPLIQAVAEGKTLQIVKMNQGSREPVWCDVESSEFIYFNLGEYARFRIKPEPKKARLKVAINKTNENKYYLCTVSDDDDVGKNLLANSKSFVKWIETLEYELPEGE